MRRHTEVSLPGCNSLESLVTAAERVHEVNITTFDLDYFSAGLSSGYSKCLLLGW